MRLLIIEDNPDDRELMTYLLRASGHTTRGVGSSESALGVLEYETPDIILCDLALPGASGHEVARELKNDPRFKRVLLIAVSAGAVGGPEAAAKAGFDGYIPKPIDPEKFVEQVMHFLEIRGDREPSGTAP